MGFPRRLKLLSPENGLVTIDAMGCQHKIASQITDQGAEYLLGVKENQSALHDALHERYIHAEANGFKDDFTDCKTVDEDRHGRFEKRRCCVSRDLKGTEGFAGRWSGLASLIMIETQPTKHSHTTLERRFYISSRVASAENFLGSVRKHWQIENKLHWVMDVAYREDESRHRIGNSPQNLAVLRHISLNLLKNEKT